MPTHIEAALIKVTQDFMWKDDSSLRLMLEQLQRPIEEGRLHLLNLKVQNEAIEIIWLKAYLDFSPTRPMWARVTDLIINMAAPTSTCKQVRGNPFMQTWNIPIRGRHTENLNDDMIRMVSAAQKFNANLATIRIAPRLRSLLPA